MSLNYVTLTFTEQDAGQGASAGPVVIAPTARVVAAGQTVVSQQPVTRQLGGGTVSVQLVACDNAGTTPAAGFWAYNITLPGDSAPGIYLVNFANGATQQFANLTPVVAQTTYGPAAGSSGFTNPMNTLGDTLYEGSSGAARLAGDTSNTRKFYREQAVAGVAQAPAWDTIQPGDLAAVGSPPPGKYSPLLYGAIWGWPWQFWADSYLAAGDGKVLGDVSITASSNVLSSASYGFVSGDVGKKVMLNGALGAAAGPLIATIASVSSGQATLSAGATVTISGNGACVFGTNDGTDLATAWAAAGTYALAHDYYAELILPAIYVDANGPTQTAGPVFNSQLPAAYPAVGGTSRKLHLALIGIAGNDHCEFWESTVPNVLPGSIVSMTTAPSSIDPTYGRQSVIGGPSGGGSFTGGFANLKLTFKNVGIWTPAYTNICAVDLGFAGGTHWEGSAAKIFAPANAGVHPYLSDFPSQVGFQSTVGMGVRFPLVQNNDDIIVPSLAVEGFETGFAAQDHFTGGRIAVIYSDLAMLVDLTESASNTSHSVTIQNLSAEAFNGGIKCNGGSGQCMLDILLDTELASGGNPTYDISDTGNVFTGVVRWTDPGRTSGVPVVSGGANLEVISGRQARSVQGAPSYTLGTAFQNPWWRHATVTLAGGTVTGISIGPLSGSLTSLGITSGTFRLPSGWWLNIAGSVKPTTFIAALD